jgi:hypothetical protein
MDRTPVMRLRVGWMLAVLMGAVAALGQIRSGRDRQDRVAAGGPPANPPSTTPQR